MTTWEEITTSAGSIVRYKAPHTGIGIFSSVPNNVIVSKRQAIELNADTLFILPLNKGEKVLAKFPIDLIRFEKFTKGSNK